MFIESLAQQIGSQAAGAGMGMILGGWNDKRQLKQQGKLQELQIAGQKEMSDYNYAKQLQMWHDTNYDAQRKELEKAGLNPALMYGMGGGGGTTTGSGGGNVQGGSAPQGGGEIQGMMGMGMQLPMIMAQKELVEAQTKKTEAEEIKTKGADTENVNADTANKILQAVVTDYTGREAKETFEKVKHPNRSIEAKTYEDEMAARQGVAGTIYDLWVDGKLEQKSLQEIEEIALKNAKTAAETRNIVKTIDLLEENIKGAKLDNIIKDLESKLPTQDIS